MDTLSNKCGRKTGKKGEKMKRRDDLLVPPIVIVVVFFKKRLFMSAPSSTLDQSSTCIIHQIRSSTYIPTYPIHHITSQPYHTYLHVFTQKPPIQIPYKSKLLSSKHNDDTPPPPPPPPPNPSKRIPIPPISNPSPIGVKMLLL